MIQHLFKLIWNKKKQNFLMISEMFVSFFVLFAVFTLLVYFYRNYTDPVGFSNSKAWVVNADVYNAPADTSVKPLSHEALRKMLTSQPGIEDVTFTGSNLPFAMSNMNNNIQYKNEQIISNVYAADLSQANVLGMHLIKGRWFDKSDVAANYKPVVINKKLQEKLLKTEEPLGKILKTDEGQMKVVGVIENIKYAGDYQPAEYSFYQLIDSTNENGNMQMMVKVKDNIDPAFESKLYTLLSGAIKNGSIEIEHLESKRASRNKLTLIPLIITMIVAGFLIVNVALGLFGVLWYNINKRKGEIGLRRAVGASGKSISVQLVGEALVIATLALLMGVFFAAQFPLMQVFDMPGSVYFLAIVLSIVSIYLLVTVCALYPGRQAAAIYPARALHED